MENKYLKNVPHQEIMQLKAQVEVLPGQVVSKTLVQNDAVGITLFAFDKGEQISTHGSDGDALVTVLEGIGEFTVGGTKYQVQTGESLIMPATIPHAVYAPESFKMMLTVVFPYTI